MSLKTVLTDAEQKIVDNVKDELHGLPKQVRGALAYELSWAERHIVAAEVICFVVGLLLGLVIGR